MSVQSDVDASAAADDVTAVAYLAAGGNPTTYTRWRLRRMAQIDPRICDALRRDALMVLGSPPERRTFVDADNH